MANKKKHLSNEERFCVQKMLEIGESIGQWADNGALISARYLELTSHVAHGRGRGSVFISALYYG